MASEKQEATRREVVFQRGRGILNEPNTLLDPMYHLSQRRLSLMRSCVIGITLFGICSEVSILGTDGLTLSFCGSGRHSVLVGAVTWRLQVSHIAASMNGGNDKTLEA